MLLIHLEPLSICFVHIQNIVTLDFEITIFIFITLLKINWQCLWLFLKKKILYLFMLLYNCTLSLLSHCFRWSRSNILIMAFLALNGPCYQTKQAQQYTLRICNFSHLGSLKRDHIKYHFSGGKEKARKE